MICLWFMVVQGGVGQCWCRDVEFDCKIFVWWMFGQWFSEIIWFIIDIEYFVGVVEVQRYCGVVLFGLGGDVVGKVEGGWML